MKQFRITTSGFARYFFGAFIVLFSWLLIAGTIYQIISLARGGTVKEWLLLPLMILFLGWVLYYFVFYLLSNQILLTDDELITSTFKKPRHPYSSITEGIIPEKNTRKIKLSDIESITLGSAKLLDKISLDSNDELLKHEIQLQKEELVPFSTRSGSILVSAWVATKYTPWFYINLNHGKSHMITTKPFSKKACRKFLLELRKRNISLKMGDVKL